MKSQNLVVSYSWSNLTEPVYPSHNWYSSYYNWFVLQPPHYYWPFTYLTTIPSRNCCLSHLQIFQEYLLFWSYFSHQFLLSVASTNTASECFLIKPGLAWHCKKFLGLSRFCLSGRMVLCHGDACLVPFSAVTKVTSAAHLLRKNQLV